MEEFETKRLILRKFKMEDTSDVYHNLTSIDSLKDCLDCNLHGNMEETKKMIQSSINEFEAGEPVWAIEEKQIHSVIGFIRIDKISRNNKRCEINFAIKIDCAGKQYLEEALNQIIHHLLYQDGFEIIILKFYDGNALIKKLKTKILENVGMKKEAVLRNRKINKKTGEAENYIVYSVMKQDIQ